MSQKLTELMKIATHALDKQAFVDAGTASGGGMDPAAMGAGGMDPAAMGMDPAAMGMDPVAMGAAPAPPPAAPPVDPAMLQQMVAQAVQQATGGSAGAQPGAGQLKPKIDVNVAIMQMSKMLARICDSLGIQIPASEMIATPSDLTAMAQQQSGAGSAQGASAIPPIQPMQGAAPIAPGGEKQSMDNVLSLGGRAAALATIIDQRARNATNSVR